MNWSELRKLARIFCRGLLLVGLVSLNTRLIAGSHLPQAALTATALSFVWWSNSKTAALSDVPYARLFYSCGAGVGTALSIWLGR